MSGTPGDLAAVMKALVEGLHPDLRKYFRPSVRGKVVAVDADAYRVDVVVGEDPTGEVPGLALPAVPVASLFAQDGYGIWALPEVDAEVTISFHEGDPTQPYVEAPIFYGNQAPSGFTTGTIAIRGKQGQKLEMRPGTNEIVISAASLKLLATDKRQEMVTGDQAQTFAGDRTVTVAGVERLEAAGHQVIVDREARTEAQTIVLKSSGDQQQQVGGTLRQRVVGSVSRQTAGGETSAVALSKREVVGGSYQMLVAATPGIAAPPPQPAWQILVMGGNADLDSLGGEVNIGANPLTPPLFVKVGSATSGPVLLGGVGAMAQPAPCGLPLQTVLSTILTVLKTTPLGIGNLGAPIAPNPAVTAALAPADAAMAMLLSAKVNISLL